MSLILGSAHALPLIDACVQCCVTSPPYWGLRDYGVRPLVWGGDPACEHEWGDTLRAPWANNVSGPNGVQKNTAKNWTKESGAFCHCGAWFGALGLEPTPDLYVAHLVLVFEEVRRVLKPDGVLWMNLGDSYAGGGRGNYGNGLSLGQGAKHTRGSDFRYPGLKAKDLVGVPWMAAFALRASGWYLRSDVIWSKPNPMPESVTDRPTKAHEYFFLLTKSERYYYDADAIKEPYAPESYARYFYPFGGSKSEQLTAEEAIGPGSRTHPIGMREYKGQATKEYDAAGVQNPSDTKRRIMKSMQKSAYKVATTPGQSPHGYTSRDDGETNAGFGEGAGRNKRTVWTVNTQPYPDAHFATFPEALIEPCILAGSRPGDLILDPFIGTGTVGQTCERLMRRWVGTDLGYQQLAKQRTRQRGLRLDEAPA